MIERPILFSSEMVQAILKGRKTQTRRVIKPPRTWRTDFYQVFAHTWKLFGLEWQPFEISNVPAHGKISCPYGIPGDRLWVRETFAELCKEADCMCTDLENRQYDRAAHYIEYKADTGNPYPGDWPEDEAKGNPDAPKWKPSIFMPRWASRITLEVIDVRVERVKEITIEDCKAEGISSNTMEAKAMSEYGVFSSLWESINSKRGYGWHSNPWVWVVTFEVVK